MNVVDSSGWLEYYADAPNADFFAAAIENQAKLLVPTISLYEVFKRVLQQSGEFKALEATALMMRGQVIDLDATIAIGAAKLSDRYGIPMADSIMLASAQAHNALLWTQDSDFVSIPNVKYTQRR